MTRSGLALGILSLVLAFGSGAACAANAQQEKMATCSSDAKTKGLKGDERKAFMKTCLAADAPAPQATKTNPQQEKMKSCNADAKTKGLKGADRKKFMSDCLKGPA